MFIKIVSCLPSHYIVMVKSTALALRAVPLNSQLFRFCVCITGVSSLLPAPNAVILTLLPFFYDGVEDMLRTSHEPLFYLHPLRRDH